MDFSDFLVHTQPITFIELLAAVTGTFYYIKSDFRTKPDQILLIFLWITFLVESAGTYSPIAHFSEYRYFSFVEGTKFERNFWLYNIFVIVTYSFYGIYFRYYLKNKAMRSALLYLVVIYIITAIVNLSSGDIFFTGISQYSMLAGAFLLFIAVVLFYYELLQSELLLSLWKLLPFYISVGALLFHLCITPIELFLKHFSAENDPFVNLRSKAMLVANIFMYSIYIVGFLLCLNQRKKSY